MCLHLAPKCVLGGEINDVSVNENQFSQARDRDQAQARVLQTCFLPETKSVNVAYILK